MTSTISRVTVMELEGTPCEAKRIAKFGSDNTEELWQYLAEVYDRGISDWIVPEQWSTDPAVQTFMTGFMVDPVRGEEQAESLGLPYGKAMKRFREEHTTWDEVHKYVFVQLVRKYWGIRYYFNKAQPEDSLLLETIEVRLNGQAAQFTEELWETLEVDRYGSAAVADHVVITGVNPETGDTYSLDESNVTSLQARNMAWLQSLVVGMADMSTPEMEVLKEHKNMRTPVLGMRADVQFLQWLLGDCNQ